MAEGAYSETDDSAPSTNIYKPLTVTGELPELTDPAADVTVNMLEMTFEMPDTVPAGPQVWQITNTGAFPHFMVIEQSPGPVTDAQVQATLEMFFGTCPPTLMQLHGGGARIDQARQHDQNLDQCQILMHVPPARRLPVGVEGGSHPLELEGRGELAVVSAFLNSRAGVTLR